MLPRRFVDALFALFNTGAAALLTAGVFFGLPARVLAVDALAVVVLSGLGVASVALLFPASRAWRRAARVAVTAVLGLGMLLVAALFFSAGHLYGIYGPVGQGGALLFLLVAALVVPYLVIFPALELVWLVRRPYA